MKPIYKVLFFFILPIIAVLLYPPAMLVSGIGVLIVVLAFFVLLGFLVLHGRLLALTFSIFMQGLNVIVRLMMFWNNGFSKQGEPNFAFIIASLLGLGLSFWLVMRLDRSDVRVQMTR
jgi:hypothetical protein